MRTDAHTHDYTHIHRTVIVTTMYRSPQAGLTKIILNFKVVFGKNIILYIAESEDL